MDLLGRTLEPWQLIVYTELRRRGHAASAVGLYKHHKEMGVLSYSDTDILHCCSHRVRNSFAQESSAVASQHGQRVTGDSLVEHAHLAHSMVDKSIRAQLTMNKLVTSHPQC